MATATLARPVQARPWIPPVLPIVALLLKAPCVLCGRSSQSTGHLCPRCESALT